ncbi:MAG: guanylate kinase [Alphaproteobacteria bacterium]|jgi:guanylate kinase|nr:guanylate kinase [Alphaproteobacteria bacterium]MCB1551219.1 guanylate kinase [Alphaproteobacteria bacterium]MCB9985587.1 guanylate kinase [Micavibrio sp.]HPQ51310.1 guanylate kinase [Alphaproteobacteria bacterium]HRK98269.1 guanylate kinase [Alphaproteobacteria bacterium]
MFLPVKRRGLLFILSSPSGAGKTTITRSLLERDDQLSISVSATTRAPRVGETDGKDYHFVSKEAFDQMVERHELLEHAKVFNNYYGTPLVPVEQALANSQDIIFDIDWQGTQQLKQKLVNDLVTIFILPPSKDELERRLRSRQQDDEDVIRERMKKASDEISHYSEYDYIIINHDLEKSILQARAILEAERCKRRRLTELPDFVRTLMQESI